MRHFGENGGVTPEFGDMIYKLGETFGINLTTNRVVAYAHALEDVTLDGVAYACMRAVKESRFFPQAAELRSYVQPSVDDAALIAWAAFQRAAGDVGAYASVETEDPAAGLAFWVVFGSWPEYCALDDRAIAARRNEYVAAYRDARRCDSTSPHRLAGILEAGGSYPADARAAVVWRGWIAANGTVSKRRDDALMLTEGSRGNVHARPGARLALEAGTAHAIEAAARSTGVEGQEGGPRGGRRS